jgi:hypothetical protein
MKRIIEAYLYKKPILRKSALRLAMKNSEYIASSGSGFIKLKPGYVK